MPGLTKSRHELFAQAVAAGQKPADAYVSVYGACKGATQSGGRLLRNAQISARIGEIRSEFSANLLKVRLSDVNFRLAALQTRHDLLTQVIAERAAAHGGGETPPLAGEPRKDGADDVERLITGPGAGTGLLCLDYRGKDAVQPIWKVDTGLLAELRAIEEQAARECGQRDGGPGGFGGGDVSVQLQVNFVQPGA